ncbi:MULTISPECIES: FAD-dependent oxidoreductase [Paraburkholderia]|uniref:FAD-dependent oxidoreductase n=2 Tax=Burkholderiaceae TaxID=119060 RepID=UPI00280AD94B|nr:MULTISPECIES: FAD-dependent monooxygenase [Paraburkholderia]
MSSISTETTRASSGVRSTGWFHGATRCISAPSKGPTARTCGSSLPAGTTWPAKSGLTLVGDAAHVMPPMGAGVNLAMLDAAELAEAIVAAANWRDAVCAQEQVMLDRAAPIVEECLRGFGEWFDA